MALNSIVKEKEVEWVFAFNEYIKKESERHNFPVISVDRGMYIDEVRKQLGVEISTAPLAGNGGGV